MTGKKDLRLSEDDFEGRKNKRWILAVFLICMIAAAGYFIVIKKAEPKEANDIDVQKIGVQNENTEETEIRDEISVSAAVNSETENAGQADGGEIFPIRTVTKEGEYLCEFSEIRLPTALKKGDFADVRLSLADGRNFTVISGKQITDFQRIDGRELVSLPLCEEEIIIMDSAISDTKLFDDSKLYLVIGSEESPNRINYPVNIGSERLLRPDEEAVQNLSGYTYEVAFDKELEKERHILKTRKGLKAEEWKEAATYWNEKE